MSQIANELFNSSTSSEKSDAVKRLIDLSTPNTDFFLMVILSVCMAGFGLLLGSSAIVIGAMLIAPVLHPVLSLAMGIVMFNNDLTRRSLNALLKSVLFAVGASFVIGLFFGTRDMLVSQEIMSRTAPSLLDAAVAVVAGFAAAFALIKPKLSESIPGIAISVSLVPPLAVVGVGLALGNFAVAKGAFLLFFINVIGIIFAAMFAFSAMNLYTKRGEATKAIKVEDKKEGVVSDAK